MGRWFHLLNHVALLFLAVRTVSTVVSNINVLYRDELTEIDVFI